MKRAGEQLASEPKRHESDFSAPLVVEAEFKEKATAALRNVFGHQEFREPQLEVVNSILKGNDTLTLLPTGRGKSLCYQLPAVMCEDKTAIVISPLIALMQDQIAALRAKGIGCGMMSSINSAAEIYQTRQDLFGSENRCRLLYLSPERLATDNFRSLLAELIALKRVSFFAIDEAHCISQWGHDFRTTYTQLGYLKQEFPDVPILALTATATDRVKGDIVDQLRFENFRFFFGTFNRPEISYEVRQSSDRDLAIARLIEEYPKGTKVIVYCLSRANCEALAVYLQDRRLSAKAYHAGLPNKERNATLLEWQASQFNIVCATIAFGMGIDKADVRLVIHRSLSKSVEGFYQESGRGGRDGLPARSVLFYHRDDLGLLRFFIEKVKNPLHRENQEKALEDMVAYCKLRTCRRVYLLKHFGEASTPALCNGTCDKCKPKAPPVQLPVLKQAAPELPISSAPSQSPKGKCLLCLRTLVPVGRSRDGGAKHKDWSTRKYHKACWKKIKQAE